MHIQTGGKWGQLFFDSPLASGTGLLFRGGGPGGWVGGSSPPLPPGGAEFLETPKALKKIFGVNYLALKAPEKNFDRSKARKKLGSIF